MCFTSMLLFCFPPESASNYIIIALTDFVCHHRGHLSVSTLCYLDIFIHVYINIDFIGSLTAPD